MIATYLADAIVDDVFGTPERYSALDALVGVYAYAVQIFADFCGYTNIAIGVALLLGFRFPQNFDNPYTAVSPRDFWRRWHMTLSRWLRDYLYIPLGGNRKGDLRHVPQPDDRDAARRALARRGVDVRRLGRAAGGWRSWRSTGGSSGSALGASGGGTKPLGPAAGGGSRCSSSSASAGSSSARTRSATRSRCSAGIAHRLGPGAGARRRAACCSRSASGSAASTCRQSVYDRLMGGFSRLSPVAQGACLALALTVVGALGPEGVAPFIYFRF